MRSARRRRGGDQGLVVGDGEPDRDAAALVEVGAASGQLADLGHHLLHEPGDLDRYTGRRQVGLTLHDADLGQRLEGVVRTDLRAEAVLEGGDDPAAVRVVLGVGRRHEHDVERQPDAVAPDLYVAFLEDVEQPDLDALGEVGQLVDGEEAAVDAGDEAVVQRELVAQVAALGDLDRVDLADEVGDGGVGSGQLLAVALRAVHPVDRRGLTELVDAVEGEARDRVVGVVVDLGAGDDRCPLVEQPDQGADHAGLRLAALAQQDDVVSGQDRVLQLGHHGVLEPEHAGDEALAGRDGLGGVAPHLLGHRNRLPPRGEEVGERTGAGRRGASGRRGPGSRKGRSAERGRPWGEAYASDLRGGAARRWWRRPSAVAGPASRGPRSDARGGTQVAAADRATPGTPSTPPSSVTPARSSRSPRHGGPRAGRPAHAPGGPGRGRRAGPGRRCGSGSDR